MLPVGDFTRALTHDGSVAVVNVVQEAKVCVALRHWRVAGRSWL